MIVLGPKYVTWCAMAIEVKGFFNFVICWTRWLLMWRIEITYPSLQKLLLFCDYICILLLAHITPYHGELVLGMHVAKYANIIAIWFESLCWFLKDQFKELQVALNDKVRQGMHWMEDCDIFLDTRLHHWKLKTWIKSKFINNVVLFHDTLKSIDIPLICVMEGKKAKSCKVLYRIHIETISKTIVSIYVLWWSDVFSIKLKVIGCFLITKIFSFL